MSETRAKVESATFVAAQTLRGEKTRQIISAIAAIEKTCFEEDIAWSEKILQRELQKKEYNLLLAYQNKKIVGYLLYKTETKDKVLEGRVFCLGVHSDHRKQGAGKKLMQQLFNVLSKNEKSSKITLQCRPYNEGFYRKLGFRPTGIIPCYYKYDKLKIPAIHMQIECSKPLLSPSEKVKLTLITNTNHEKDDVVMLGEEKAEAVIRALKVLSSSLRKSTSFWYGGFLAKYFHSRRKEQAFLNIEIELQAQLSQSTKVRGVHAKGILRALIHNAMLIRGFGFFSKETTSGKALVSLLNNAPQFKVLKPYLPKQCSYENLRIFSKLPLENAQSPMLKDNSQLQKTERSRDLPKPYNPYYFSL